MSAVAEPKLTDEQREEIRQAPATTPNAELAARYGVTTRTVQRIRKEARQERDEVRREVVSQEISRQVTAHLPDALRDLQELREIAGREFRRKKATKMGELWLRSTVVTLDRLGVEKAEDPLEGLSDEVILLELEVRGVVKRV